MKRVGPLAKKAFQDFFAMSLADQWAAIDKELQENMERQKQWGGPFPPGPPPSGDKSGSAASPGTPFRLHLLRSAVEEAMPTTSNGSSSIFSKRYPPTSEPSSRSGIR